MAVAHRDVAGLLKKRGYTEIKKIGEGSFGKAILIQGREGGRLVCKMVDVSKATPKEQREAMHEGQMLASLKHPYIVRYRENFTESGWFCILMDYCEGGDLTKQIEKARKGGHSIFEEQVLRWFTQAILALKYIHDRHILHRDLKPSNFFLSKSGSLKMGDFGISKVLSCTIACARTQIGTPYYLSPEVCQEKPYAWPSDIWAMGCILYEMCAQKVPFDAPNIASLVQKICRGPIPTVPRTYSEPVRQLCSDMLSRTSNQRPTTDDILKRPKIQGIVRQMLEEAQAAEGDKSPKGQVATRMPAPLASQVEELSRAVNPGVGRDPDSAAAHAGAKPAAHGAHGDAAGMYLVGDLIEYHSNTHGDWLAAKVLKVDNSGRIVIDLKPNTWISPDEQAKRIRPRGRSPGDAHHGLAPRVAAVGAAQGAAPAARHRSPQVGAGGGRNAAPAQRQRSPSVGPVHRAHTPSPAAVAAGVGGIAASPLRSRSPAAPSAASPTPPQRRSPAESPSPMAVQPCGIGGGHDPDFASPVHPSSRGNSSSPRHSPGRLSPAPSGDRCSSRGRNTPRRSDYRSPSPQDGNPCASPGGMGSSPEPNNTPRIRPPCIPRMESPFRRKNAAAGSAGMAIAGG